MDEVHPSVLHSLYTDPREPQGPRQGQVAPSIGNTNRIRPRQFSLPEASGYEPCQDISSVFTANRKRQNAVRDPDNSSLSSYKETSPEVEHIPTRTELRIVQSEPRIRRGSHLAREAFGSEPRSQTITPSVRSLDLIRSKARSHSTHHGHDSGHAMKRARSKSMVETARKLHMLESRPLPKVPCTSHCSPVSSSHKSSRLDSSSDDEEPRPSNPAPIALPHITYLDVEEKSDSTHTLTEHTNKDCSTDSVTKKAKQPSKLFRMSALLKGDGQQSTNGDSARSSQSQQSSIVGLDWLFGTDTDSMSSGKLCVCMNMCVCVKRNYIVIIMQC
ncbi:hypothetical protein LSH36_162g06035 [Paralvinella palmiformis]|uniref:Uncharacterized protein n=1 Tax=Paralvinella palmiformis TaxID=53620 RepID=A0AAD9N8G2_9ANNE|nr:hypothetical protein LSH36_162g06035 [Paralvinella palmiformis]